MFPDRTMHRIHFLKQLAPVYNQYAFKREMTIRGFGNGSNASGTYYHDCPSCNACVPVRRKSPVAASQ